MSMLLQLFELHGVSQSFHGSGPSLTKTLLTGHQKEEKKQKTAGGFSHHRKTLSRLAVDHIQVMHNERQSVFLWSSSTGNCHSRSCPATSKAYSCRISKRSLVTTSISVHKFNLKTPTQFPVRFQLVSAS
ncbi:hypothetical protein M758_12G149600 [Ceratodon purpureus]|uniref:Uncharacterized protein n=1 Tax=Ceratodon purpureus TaxID=3225 RepID=A0A8T0G8K0_CERPU|nr:hypothetical protein KC19_12G147000 [Ceratodon purpureus]KAG0599401.1 hypothetical protein M758_12G149600 [Ceratodon purpureus]